MNYFENDLKSLHEGLVNKDFSAEELAKETFETIKKREEKIDAFITLDEERAMEKHAQSMQKESMRETCLTEFLSGSKTTS